MYQIRKLHKFAGLFHAFSTVDNGNMAHAILGEDKNTKKVHANRTKFFDEVGIETDNTVVMWVVHGDKVVDVKRDDLGIGAKNYTKSIKCDAMITNIIDSYIFLLIADCAPIIIYEPKREVMAVVHAGWKGADLNIVGKVIKRLRDNYDCKVEDLVVGIGPAARKETYIKSNPEQLGDPRWKPFLHKTPNRHPDELSVHGSETMYKIDFLGLVKQQLVESGVKHKNLYDCGVDTINDERFFSHYRDARKGIPDRGRFACLAGMN